jgi:ABC-type branched-subunit amino acid transport system substrate-binding protein
MKLSEKRAKTVCQPAEPYVFHLRASYRQEIDKIVSHLATLGVRSVGIVHHADPFGDAGLETAVAALSRRGLTPPVVARFAERDAAAGDAARIIAGANPAAVIMIAAHDNAATFLRALRSTGYRPMLFGLSIIDADQLVRELGDQAHGLVVARVLPSPFRLDYPFVRDYRYFSDKARLAYSYPALEGYLAATVFTEALLRAGRDLTTERLVAALEGMTDWDAGGLKLQYSTHNHVGLDYVDLTVIGRGNGKH